MTSNDIFINITERMIEIASYGNVKIAGIPVMVAFGSKEKQAEVYKRALYDYSIEKLLDTEENKVIVEDLGFIFARLNEQFASVQEQEAFYTNYVHCLLSAYNDLTGRRLDWYVADEAEAGDFPKIGGSFVTKPSTTSEEAAIWIYREYEKELKTLQEKKESSNQYKKSRWNWFKK